MGSPIVADPSAPANAQGSAAALTRACTAAAGTVSALGGVALPDCVILAAAWPAQRGVG